MPATRDTPAEVDKGQAYPELMSFALYWPWGATDPTVCYHEGQNSKHTRTDYSEITGTSDNTNTRIFIIEKKTDFKPTYMYIKLLRLVSFIEIPLKEKKTNPETKKTTNSGKT